jgi:small GTP-binding protein
MEDYDYAFKIIILGDTSVGKTSLLKRYTNGTYSEDFLATIGVDFYPKIIEVNRKKIKFQVWDIVGHQRFRYPNRLYYRRASGVVIAYDCTDKNFFSNIENWIKEIRLNADDSVCKVIAATKCDLIGNTLNTQTAETLKQEFGIKVFETSSKENINVNQAFEYLIQEILQKYEAGVFSDKNIFHLNRPANSNPNTCC